MTVLREYAARVGQPELGAISRFDEMVGPDGALRPAWKGLAEVAIGLTPDDLRRVESEIVRSLADDGVTYNRDGRRAQPWRLDPLPLVIEAAEWERLEVGLAQRAELLNAILVDLYGEQRLLSSGVLPPAAVFGHPGFVRLVARRSAGGTQPLTVAAHDLGRTADGRWTVLGDRAQAPSGIGYAMENRRVISRVLPELYREASLHRMGPFYAALRSALIQAAPVDESQARVVVLSPGSHSETAFDQAFVAAHLGFSLVEGSDLVVRDGCVWLRGVDRPERVHVILRRVDAAFSDPLELRGDSQLGVAGLAEACRRGTVRVVNGLGAGVLENPALLPYQGAMCRLLLDEEPILPTVLTWWGGEAAGLDVLLSHAERLVVRRIDGGRPLNGPVDQVRAQVLAAPHRYVGQERLLLSQAPVAGRAGIRPSPVSVRTFTLHTGGAYRPLLGGLGSVVGEDGLSRSSKDVWVLKRGSADPDQGLREPMPISTLRAVEASVPRVLDDMFWLGRTAERVEAMLRLVIVVHALSENTASDADRFCAQVMHQVVNRLAGTASEELDSDLRSVLLDVRRDGGVAQAVATMRDTAQSVRDQLSPDVWRTFGVHDRAVGLLVESPHPHQVAESAGRMLTAVLALDGVVANMMRDPGWHLIALGRSLERALQLCFLLQGTTIERRGLDVDRRVLDAALAVAESAVTHRRRYRGHVRPRTVLDLLLLDDLNPRSLRFTLRSAADHLAALPRSTGTSRPERRLAGLLEQVEEVDSASLVAIGGASRPNLRRFLEATVVSLQQLADSVVELHATSGPAPRPFTGLLVEP
ncbi:hypothetical protein D9V37_17610 [Nocardioides mangrovicus]|uniref:Uncharacterized protein n=1 Tax=Nocardioides mangrovicus TaxID=2478913 RepID=A0A3L8NZ43_9ACTN|nr:circularly permuted type 2 ATP-grasp protein [Nocardioides mangrovicus]RLV47927.1 hypothetical protein D9V37_17610 [Nocardioides mangrovicus]